MAEMTRSEFNKTILGATGASMLTPRAEANRTQAKGAQANTEPHEERHEPTGAITDVPGITVGHYTDSRRPTGVTVLLFGEKGAATGVDFDGSAPGTFQVSLLQPVSFIQEVWGIVLSGGSSFGLASVPGAVRYLEEQKIGLKFGIGIVPIVVGAIIYDLGIGDSSVRPDAEAAYRAATAATANNPEQGNIGAGAGATVGKMLGQYGMRGMKSGVGMASMRIGDVVIGALMVVNAVGDIVDWKTGKVIAGARRSDGKGFVGIPEILRTRPPHSRTRASITPEDPVFQSTTIGVVATNAEFNKTEMTKIAMMANCGAARCINPYHTPGDGDTLFAVSTRRTRSDLSLSVIGSLAAEVVSEAVVQCAKMASSIPDWPAYRDYTAKL